MQICIHRKDNSPKPVNHCLTLKEGPKVKSNIRRFLVSRINNKQVISTLRFGSPRLMLKEEGLKVKSDHIKRFPAHDFLYVGLPSETSTTNNKRVISNLSLAILV